MSMYDACRMCGKRAKFQVIYDECDRRFVIKSGTDYCEEHSIENKNNQNTSLLRETRYLGGVVLGL